MQTYLEPTQESGRAFFMRSITGRVVMLNLLRYRATADYSATPQLAPATAITGEAAYRRYMEHTMPHLERSGGFGAEGVSRSTTDAVVLSSVAVLVWDYLITSILL